MSEIRGWRWSLLLISGLFAAAVHAAPAVPAQATPNITGKWALFEPADDGQANAFDPPPPPAGDPDLKTPYASAYKALRKRQATAHASGKPLMDSDTLCLPQGMPTIMGATYSIQILQNPGQVTVLAEFLTQTRRIFLDEMMPALDDISPGYNGYSVGHWDGDTLVVETLGVREDVRFFDFPHSSNMKITERIRLAAPERLEDRIVIDDPQVLNTPYRFTFNYEKTDRPIMEYICDNNHYAAPDKQGRVVLKREHNKKP